MTKESPATLDEISTQYLRDFGASLGNRGFDETSRLFGLAADEIDRLRALLRIPSETVANGVQPAYVLHTRQLEEAIRLAIEEDRRTRAATTEQLMNTVRSYGSTHTNEEILKLIDASAPSAIEPKLDLSARELQLLIDYHEAEAIGVDGSTKYHDKKRVTYEAMLKERNDPR